jgi:hypothetical protein
LYGLLRAIRPGWPAAFSTGFFALLMVNVPLVNWPNIDPYLVFITLFLFLLRECYFFHLDGDEARIKRAAGLLTVAIFIYDAGILFSASLFMYFFLLLPRPRRLQAFWILFPVGLYLMLSVLDLYFVHPYIGSEPARIAKGLFAWSLPINFLMALKWLFLGGIFAAPTEMAELGRTVLLPHTLGWAWPFTKWSPYVLRGSVFLIMCGSLIAIGVTRDFLRKRKAFYYLLATILLSYVLLIVCGRMVSRGILGSLFLNCHYFYLFWAMLIILFYAMVDWQKCFEFKFWPSFQIVAVFVVLLMMAAGAFSIRAVNVMVAKEQRKTRTFLTVTEKFVEAHRNEPDFSFFVPHSCPGNYPGRWLHRHLDFQWRRYTLAEIYYPQYYRPRWEAKYFIPCSAFSGEDLVGRAGGGDQ